MAKCYLTGCCAHIFGETCLSLSTDEVVALDRQTVFRGDRVQDFGWKREFVFYISKTCCSSAVEVDRQCFSDVILLR